MTESKWLSCTDPRPMLEFLRGKVSERKMRLFAFACCNEVRAFLEPSSVAALDTAGRYADSLVGASTLAKARTAASNALEESDQVSRGGALVVKWLCHKDVELQCGVIARESADFIASRQPRHLIKATRRFTLLKQSRIFRDICNPFCSIAIDSEWITPTVINLATAAYQEPAMPLDKLDSGRLAVLADALEDEGCDNQEILGHLRSPGPHVRGCFALDLLLGKD